MTREPQSAAEGPDESAQEQNESVQLWKEQAFHWEKRCAQQMTDLANARHQADEGNALFNGIVGILGAPPATVTTTAAFIEWVRAELAHLQAAMEEARQLIFDDCADDARAHLAAALKGTKS